MVNNQNNAPPPPASPYAQNAQNMQNSQNSQIRVLPGLFWRVTGQVQIGASNRFNLEAATVQP